MKTNFFACFSLKGRLSPRKILYFICEDVRCLHEQVSANLPYLGSHYIAGTNSLRDRLLREHTQ